MVDTAEVLEAFYKEHAPELLQGRRSVDGALTALRRKAAAKGLSGNQVDDFVFSTVASRHGADPRKWYAVQQRRAVAPPRLSATALERHNASATCLPCAPDTATSAPPSRKASSSVSSRRSSKDPPSLTSAGGSSAGSSQRQWNVSQHDGNAQKKLSYFTYNKLVGDADGGKELPKEQFEELVDRYHASWQDGSRMYVTWACTAPGRERECIRCKPNFSCFCGHRLNAHDTLQDRSTACRAPGCQCRGYLYLHCQGSFRLRCRCKHEVTDHADAGRGPCTKPGCNECPGAFATSFVCQCGGSWGEHAMVVESEAERAAAGKPTDREKHRQRREEGRRKKSGCGSCTNCKNMFGRTWHSAKAVLGNLMQDLALPCSSSKLS